MVADIRATISCSLGEVISGNWSDEAVGVGQGLIRCRGQLILKGVHVPAAGTVVKLAYVRDGYLAKVPRVLRVLSSFADPLRQTTTVQLGDKLVWLEGKKQGPLEPDPVFPGSPVAGDTVTTELPYPAPEFGTENRLETRVHNGVCWKKQIIDANDRTQFDWKAKGVAPWEQNPDRPADEEMRAPVTISAFFIASKCLAALGITSTGILLTSHYEPTEFDFKNGYVAALEQLLSQESYVGYLDEQERLAVQPLTLYTPGTGPLLSEEDVIDIGPIGSGELPQEDPNVLFQEPEAKEPQDPDPVAPVAANFIGGASYQGLTVSIPNGDFTTKAKVDPAMYQLSKIPGLVALYSVSAGTGGAVVQGASGVVFTPEAGFNGTATFTYQVTDGQQLSNSATVSIRVSANAATPAEEARDIEEAPGNDAPASQQGTTWTYADGGEEKLTVTYTAPNGSTLSKTYASYPGSKTAEVANSNGGIVLKREEQAVGRAQTLGSALQRHLEAGLDPGANGNVTVVTITKTQYQPVNNAGASRTKPETAVGGSVCTINGECPADLEFPPTPASGDKHRYGNCVYEYSAAGWMPSTGTADTEQDPRLTLGDAKRDGYIADVQEEPTVEVASTYEPGEMAIGSLNWPTGTVPPLSAPPYLAEQVRTEYYRNRGRGITRTVTTRFQAFYKSPEGQQQLAAQGDSFAESGGFQDWLTQATRLVFVNQTSNTRFDANFGIRPAAPDAAPKDGRFDGEKAATTGATPTGPTTATTSAEVREPDVALELTPAVPRTWTPEQGYQELQDVYERANARVLALRKARAQFAVAYGNRYGTSLQVVPWSLPRYPLEPLYLQLAGVVAACRSNGLTVAFDSNGVVANVDALLTGGVGGVGSPWFPVPPTVTTLPLAPSSTSNPGAFPLSSIPVPPDFDPADPGDALDSIPSADAVTYPTELAPDYIIPPVAPTVTALRGIRVGLRVQRLDYAVTPLEREVSIGVNVGMAYGTGLAINVAAITYSQSSVYTSNTAATNAGMTDGSFNTGSQTGTDGTSPEWVKMDLGAIYPITSVVVGCDFDEVLPGGWDKTYAENCDIEISDDDITWTPLENTGTFAAGIQTYPVSTSGRYIRILDNGGGFLAVTEFYATN
jgi:hypothetical protein